MSWGRASHVCFGRLKWLLPCVVVYATWIVLYQNVLHKSRHVLPLLIALLLVMPVGISDVLRKQVGRGLLVIGGLAYGTVALVLVAQHHQPTAIAQVVEVVREISHQDPDLRVVAVPLVTFMLDVQAVEAEYVQVDDPETLASIASSDQPEHPIVSIGVPIGNWMPDAELVFYHNPFVNRMWPEIPVYLYGTGS